MPVRVRWDVDFRGRPGRTKRIARQIREIAPLFVELRIEGEKGVSELSAIFTEIHKSTPKVAATIGLFPGSAAVSRRGYPIDFIWAVSAGSPFAGLLPGSARAISFTPDEDTIGALPRVLEEFAGSRALELHLPNVNAVRSLADKGHVPVPRPEQLREVARTFSKAGICLAGRKLSIHDHFLWEALRKAYPEAVGTRVEFSGCQAGSALVHVDWEGNVYPCDSLPIRLGNLIETPFAHIWRSPARQHVSAAIKEMPASCGTCGAYGGCLGGCRGLAYLASKSLDSRDPSCPVAADGSSTGDPESSS